jgi:hypothetical protein
MKRFESVVAVLVAVAVVAVAAAPAAAEACPPPVLDGFAFGSLTADNVPCAEARELALHVVRPRLGPVPEDWSCTATVSGKAGIHACVNRLDASRRVNFTVTVL